MPTVIFDALDVVLATFLSLIANDYGPTCVGLVMWRAVQLGPSFSLQHSPMFILLLLFTMVERLVSFASDVAIERDWLTKLVGENRPHPMICVHLHHADLGVHN